MLRCQGQCRNRSRRVHIIAPFSTSVGTHCSARRRERCHVRPAHPDAAETPVSCRKTPAESAPSHHEEKNRTNALGCSRSDLRGRGIRMATSAVECASRRSQRSAAARRVCRSSCPETQTTVSTSIPHTQPPITMTLFTSLVRAVSLRSTQKCRKTLTNGCCHPGWTAHLAVASLKRVGFHLAGQYAFLYSSPSHTVKSAVILTNLKS